MEQNNQEKEVNRLLQDSRRERKTGSYGNWALKDVPIEVIWNEFSRSNWKLVVEI